MIKNWTDSSIEHLQSCFECTDWDGFLNGSPDLNDQVLVVLNLTFVSFLLFWLTVFPSNKPWVTKELKNILNMKKKTTIFLSGTNDEKKVVKRAIRCAKLNYRNKIERKFIQGDMRAVWYGIKNMPDITITKKGPVEKRNADFFFWLMI